MNAVSHNDASSRSDIAQNTLIKTSDSASSEVCLPYPECTASPFYFLSACTQFVPRMRLQVKSYVSTRSVFDKSINTSALLRRGYIVPNIVPEFSPTIGPLTITYPRGIVNYGNALNLSVVTYNPSIQFSGEPAYPDAKYTILMVRPLKR